MLLEVENHHPKNRSIALLTMPELRIGVVGVPVMSLALCAVLYATWANGRGRLIDMLWNESNSILVNHFQNLNKGKLPSPKTHTYCVRDFPCQWWLDLCSMLHRSWCCLPKCVRDNSVLCRIRDWMQIANEPNYHFAVDRLCRESCHTGRNAIKSLKWLPVRIHIL